MRVSLGPRAAGGGLAPGNMGPCRNVTTAVRITVLMVASVCACGLTERSSPSTPSVRELRHPGCFLVYDMNTRRTRVWEAQACDLRTSPASTFKIPHALIGLETGVIPSAEAVRPWDEEKHSSAPWGHADQTLTTAIRDSVVWYFQEVAAELGENRMLDYLERFDYGNKQVGGYLTTFWLDGTLAISGHEQMDFLRRFWLGKLPVAKRHVDAVREILTQPITALRPRVGEPGDFDRAWGTTAKTAFKTGATVHGAGHVTWLVGRVQDGENDVVFVSRVTGEGPPSARSSAVEGALQSLLDLGLL